MAVETGYVLPGEIEQHADIFVLVIGDVEDLAEGADLVAGDLSVGLGQLGAQRNNADGEGLGLVAPLSRTAEHGFEADLQCAQNPLPERHKSAFSDRETACASHRSSPVRRPVAAAHGGCTGAVRHRGG